jgi:excinuclease ABC subunit A
MTGHEAYLKLVLRVPGRNFKEDQLAAQLALRPLSDTPGLEGYSRDSNRVEVGNWPGAQYVVVVVNRKSEIDTPAFRAFLKRAAEAFLSRLKDAAGGVESQMPWKKDGEKWHLGEKGFPPGQGAKWDRSLLPRVIKVLREIDPTLEFKWDARDAVTIRPPGSPRMWARLKTKESAALECWVIARPGQFNLSRVEGVGTDPVIESDRNDGVEVLKLRFVSSDHLHPPRLKALLAEYLKGFKAAFRSGAEEKEAG